MDGEVSTAVAPDSRLKRVWRAVVSRPAGRLIGIVGVFVSIALTLYFGVQSLPSPPAQLSVTIASDDLLFKYLDINDLPLVILGTSETGERFTLGPPEAEPRIVRLEFENVGGESLTWSEMFERPLMLRLEDRDAKIVGFSQARAASKWMDQPTIRAERAADDRTLEVSGDFLKPNETATLIVLHTGREGALRLHARAKGMDTLFNERDARPFSLGRNSFVASLHAQTIVKGMAFGVVAFFVLAMRLATKRAMSWIVSQAVLFAVLTFLATTFMWSLLFDVIDRLQLPVWDAFYVNAFWMSYILVSLSAFAFAYPAECKAIVKALRMGQRR